MNVTKAT